MLHVPYGSPYEEYHHKATLSYEIILKGCNEFGLHNQWNFQSKLLIFGGVLVEEKFAQSVSLLRDRSLLINPVLLEHDGVYECIRNLTTVARHFLEVEGRVIIYS